jgi:hypothetical protein
MGRGSDLERSDGNNGDDAEETNPAVPRGARWGVVACGALSAAAPEEPEPAEPEPDEDAGPEPAVAAQPPRQVASEKMKAALMHARTAKAEKRRKRSQATILASLYFFDIV